MGDHSAGQGGTAAGRPGEAPRGIKRERGEGSPGARPTPHTPHPTPPPGFPIWAGAACQQRPHVCASGDGEATGAAAARAGRARGAPLGADGRLTRGLRGRRPPGPACAAAAERPRPSGRRRGKDRRAGRGAESGAGGGELGYLCLFPDHIVGAEQVSQE